MKILDMSKSILMKAVPTFAAIILVVALLGIQVAAASPHFSGDRGIAQNTTPNVGGTVTTPPATPNVGGTVTVPPQPASEVRTTKLLNPLKVDTLIGFLNLVLDIILIIAVPIIIFFIIWSGFMYVTAQGKPEKIADATRAFTWTVVGAVILLGAKVLLAIITNTVKALSV